MLFCKSSTVNVGTMALICTASCVVAKIASFGFAVFRLQAIGPRPDIQARPCDRAEVLLVGFDGLFQARRTERSRISHVKTWQGAPRRLRDVCPYLGTWVGLI